MSKENSLIATLVVFLGGMIGGAARYLLGELPMIGKWPLTTIFINCLGTLLLAYLGTYIKESKKPLQYRQAFIGTGILGGFTTFGALISQSMDLGWKGEPELSVLLIAGSLFLAYFMVLLGKRLAHFTTVKKASLTGGPHA
ncbi:CrcB family protein [Fructobacillus sp. M2-14]|uniref:Fluoride-specific ion channel FluC n=1 Tax=Fructobacillus broussonetiae TaxID=2713173 RepID=A0ABS5QZT7_9LACO|nr:CrcB family protein [Fructobacillus broussonetiae]MBS9338703.1 CrcB family protein [Fructobacillus broussonetiae]